MYVSVHVHQFLLCIDGSMGMVVFYSENHRACGYRDFYPQKKI